MNIIKMDDQEVHNLLQFLDRVELKGLGEVQEFNKILFRINERTKESTKNNK